MTGYEYGNARLHAMKSRLLSRRDLEAIIQTGSLQGMIAEVTKTAYRPSVEAALARTTGMDSVTEALHHDLSQTLGKIRTFYRNQAGKAVLLLLQAYDIHNLKAILRGLSRNVPVDEFLPALLPIGELKSAFLVELVNTRDARIAIDLLASLMIPYARPLVHLRTQMPGAPEFEMELVLDRWYVTESRALIKVKIAKGRKLLFSYFDLEADITNILTALRFAHAPAARTLPVELSSSGDIERLFVPPGKVSLPLLVQAAAQDSVPAAVALLEGTPYAAPLRSGLELFNTSGRLSSIEKSLRRFRLEKLVSLIPKDPLGIGLVMGYIALKINEVNNLSCIAHALHIGLNPEAIRLEVEWIG